MANLGPNLSQRLTQSQTLALTPAMQLKLKLWQMNLLELSQTIERELEENPLLEETQPDEGIEDEVHLANEDDVQSIEKQDVKVIERTDEITGEGDGREEFDCMRVSTIQHGD